MVTAVWKGVEIARSDSTVVVEGNHYFPPESVRTELLQPSSKTTTCGWKGTARYMNVVTPEGTNADAVWFYPETKPEADKIKGYFAFWKGVTVSGNSDAGDQTPDSASCSIE